MEPLELQIPGAARSKPNPTMIDPSETGTPNWIHPRFPRLPSESPLPFQLNLSLMFKRCFHPGRRRNPVAVPQIDFIPLRTSPDRAAVDVANSKHNLINGQPSSNTSRRPIAVPTSERCSGQRRLVERPDPGGNALRASHAGLLAALSRSSRSTQALNSQALLRSDSRRRLISQPRHIAIRSDARR